MSEVLYNNFSDRNQNGDFLKKMPGGAAILRIGDIWELVDGNEEFFRAIGYTKREVAEMPEGILQILYRPDFKALKDIKAEVNLKESTGDYELRIITKHGKLRWFVFRASFYQEQHGITYCLVSIWDIHGHKKMEEELHVQTARYKMVENITKEMPFDFDVESGEMLISDKYLMVRGMHDVMEHFAKWKEQKAIIYYEDYEKFLKAMDQAASKEKKGMLELRLNISNPEEAPQYAWYRINYKSISGINGKIVRVLGRIINIHQEKLKQIQKAEPAKRDRMTGVLNKAATQSAVDQFLLEEHQGSHALFIIDIDNFMCINNSFGHLFGDTVLINIAEKILRIFRDSDIVGRIGGDKFLVLMKNAAKLQIEERASLICEKVRQSYTQGGEAVEISCSIGIALSGTDGINFGTLFQKADAAMYEVKEQGKDAYKFVESGIRITEYKKEKEKGRGGPASHEGPVEKVQDREFITTAFSLLTNARDLNSSLNLLMERIGRRYSLDSVAVLVEKPVGKILMQTNCWRDGMGIVENPIFVDKYENWDGFLKGFDARGIYYINDCQDDGVPENDKRVFREHKIQALVNCRFSYGDLKTGIVTFCNFNKPRVWNEFEKETFLELTRLVAVFVSLRDRQEEDEKAISLLKRLDPLTGLYNEAAFLEKARGELEHMEPNKVYAFVYSDINNFSYINENFGKEAGNQILKDYAKIISAKDKVFSSRLHSDMFMTMVIDDNREVTRIKVEQDARDFIDIQKLKYPQSNLKLSIGIYYIERKHEDIEVAIENANMARKSLKRDSTDTICRVYCQELQWKKEMENQIISEFIDALNGNQFQVYLQPQFILQDMSLAGAEALVRWRRRDGALEFPNAFIPILEKSGDIVELDFYVLKQVLHYLQKWKSRGKELKRISVNFSKRHFEGHGIYRRISQLAEEYGIPHEFIEIEITESILVSDAEIVKREMELLRRDGYFVAVDDFGTGFSPLSMLRDIPADVVKMDKSFLEGSNLEEGQAFISNMGELIRSAKREVIFKGIETTQQLEFLEACGFHYGQGFLFDRPMPIQVFEEKYMN